MGNFQIERVESATLGEVAEFLQRWRENETAQTSVAESASAIERRLRWLTVDNPAVTPESPFGFCVRDDNGVVRGLNLAYPAVFVAGDQRPLGLGSGSFFVELQARSMGFFLFKKYLGLPGYSFYFATTCNANSAALWSKLGALALPDSDIDYVLPLRLDVILPALVVKRTSSEIAAGMARMGGRYANSVLRLLTRPSGMLTLTPCRDWEKLAELARRHRPSNVITSDRSAAFLRWRYGPDSPVHPSEIYLFRDRQGNEGWFVLGNLIRGEKRLYRGSVLLDAVWPSEKMSFKGILNEILRLSAEHADAIFLRSFPGLNYREFSRFVVAHRLSSPRGFARASKGAVPGFAPGLALDRLDYDDRDFGAWKKPWNGAATSAEALEVSVHSGAA